MHDGASDAPKIPVRQIVAKTDANTSRNVASGVLTLAELDATTGTTQTGLLPFLHSRIASQEVAVA